MIGLPGYKIVYQSFDYILFANCCRMEPLLSVNSTDETVDSHMWRLSIPTMHYTSAVIGHAGKLGREEKRRLYSSSCADRKPTRRDRQSLRSVRY
ncbi:hypothetical protein HZ326_19160 [Fusarium oxysporum f. sp. albedinis]|nr:Uncharacterized protein HZ326_19710 [Fusarium oxysporum f. sp. albedinis]KAJ0137887.1 hypothetical protein HZ326_19160 [Fusarium oxysporum f. sp. albedinis]